MCVVHIGLRTRANPHLVRAVHGHRALIAVVDRASLDVLLVIELTLHERQAGGCDGWLDGF